MRFASSTSCAAVRSWWRPASRRKSCSASVVVSTGAVSATTASEWGGCSTISIERWSSSRRTRVLLELGELVRLGDLGEVGRAHVADLLGCSSSCRMLLDEEDVFDIDLGHARRMVLGR